MHEAAGNCSGRASIASTTADISVAVLRITLTDSTNKAARREMAIGGSGSVSKLSPYPIGKSLPCKQKARRGEAGGLSPLS
jgi:hypothetical protein